MEKQIYYHKERFETFEQIEARIAEHREGGYECAVLGANMKAVKYGSLVSDVCELPDKPKNCTLFIWNNDNIDEWLINNDYQVK